MVFMGSERECPLLLRESIVFGLLGYIYSFLVRRTTPNYASLALGLPRWVRTLIDKQHKKEQVDKQRKKQTTRQATQQTPKNRIKALSMLAEKASSVFPKSQGRWNRPSDIELFPVS